MIVPVLRTWMRAVSEISRAVNVADPLDVVLARVADLACELIGFDFCAVMLADGSSERLDIVGWSGLTEDYLANLRDGGTLQIRPDSPGADSPAARAYRNSDTIAVADVRRDTESYGRLSLSPLQGYHSLVASPLNGSGSPVGVLVGYSAAPRRYGNADIELTELLAEQTATAIHTARFRAGREWVEQQHRRLMQLVLDEAGLGGLVGALSDALSAPVAVIDTEGRVLAAAETDAGAVSWGELPRVDPEREPSYSAGPIVVGDYGAWTTPVVIAGQTTARLWILGEQAVSDSASRRLVEQFALVVGIEMLTARHALEVEERLSGDLLTDVLRGEGLTRPQVLLDRAGALGFDLTAAHHVVLISADGITEHLAAVTRHVRYATRTAVLATVYGEDIVLMTLAAPDALNSLSRVRQQIDDSVSSAVTIVISPLIHELGDVGSVYRAVAGAARLRAAADARGIVDLRHLSVLVLMLMADSPAVFLQRLAEQLIRPVAVQDQRRDTQLLTTLRTWLDCGFSAGRAATALTVHVNTVGQRLVRLEKLVARDLSLANTRLDLQLALHVWDVMHVKMPV